MSAQPTALPFDDGLPFMECRLFEPEFFDSAPCRYVNVVELPVSAEQAFDVFEDPESWPKWAPGIGSVEWTSPKPYGPGTTRTVRFWGGMAVYEDFNVFDRPREMCFRFYGTSERVWNAFGERYRVEALGDDRCRLEWTVAFDPAGWFGRLQPLIRPALAVNFKLYMWLLKRYCRRLK